MRALVLAALFAATLSAQDLAKVSPDDVKVEIDNQWVHVMRVKFAPHASHPMHEHPNTVAVYLTDVHTRFTNADGTTQDSAHKAGDVAWIESAHHAEVNLSDSPAEIVLVELKPGSIHSKPVELDPVKLEAEYVTVPLENSRVRVLRTVLEPHHLGPVHDHPSYVVVYLTELHTTQKLADGRTVDNPRKPGEIAWRDAYRHQTENVGDHTAVELQIELK